MQRGTQTHHGFPRGRFPIHKKPAKTSVLCSNHLPVSEEPIPAGHRDGHDGGSREAHDATGMETRRGLFCLPSHTAGRSQTWNRKGLPGDTPARRDVRPWALGELCPGKLHTSPFSPLHSRRLRSTKASRPGAGCLRSPSRHFSGAACLSAQPRGRGPRQPRGRQGSGRGSPEGTAPSPARGPAYINPSFFP